MDLKQIYRKETNLEPYEDIEVMNNFTLSYVKWLEAKINNTRSCRGEAEQLVCDCGSKPKDVPNDGYEYICNKCRRPFAN